MAGVDSVRRIGCFYSAPFRSSVAAAVGVRFLRRRQQRNNNSPSRGFLFPSIRFHRVLLDRIGFDWVVIELWIGVFTVYRVFDWFPPFFSNGRNCGEVRSFFFLKKYTYIPDFTGFPSQRSLVPRNARVSNFSSAPQQRGRFTKSSGGFTWRFNLGVEDEKKGRNKWKNKTHTHTHAQAKTKTRRRRASATQSL